MVFQSYVSLPEGSGELGMPWLRKPPKMDAVWNLRSGSENDRIDTSECGIE